MFQSITQAGISATQSGTYKGFEYWQYDYNGCFVRTIGETDASNLKQFISLEAAKKWIDDTEIMYNISSVEDKKFWHGK